MAAIVLTNAAIYVAQADLSGKSNKVELDMEADEIESTTFGPGGFRSYVGGLKSASVNIEGNFEALDTTYPDERLWTDLGAANVPHTFSPTGGADGDLAYFLRSMRSKYTAGGSVGDLMAFTGDATTAAGEGIIRGTIMNPAGTARTATGSGSVVQLGALSATQRMWVAFHVLSIAGTSTPTITMRLQSAALVGFGSPTARVTFTAATAIGAQFSSVAGAVTDQFWRADWTISGSGPSFLCVVAAGIGSM